MVARMEECSSFKYLAGRPIEKRLLGRPTCRWKDIIRIYQPVKRLHCCMSSDSTSLAV